MTRINLVLVQELSDKHLLAEYRELPRILGNVREHLNKGKTIKDVLIPKSFVLGQGHMKFFYNKLNFLKKRHACIVKECLNRNMNIKFTEPLDISEFDSEWCGDYTPCESEIDLSKSRINDRIKEKPKLYSWTNSVKPDWVKF